MGILRLRPRRAALMQTLPLRPLQPSTHSANVVRTSRSHRRHGSRDCDIRHRENSYDSVSESSGDESCCEDKSTQWENSRLLCDPGIQVARQHLLPVARAQFDNFHSRPVYTELPHHEQTRQKRGDECDWVIPTFYHPICYREFRPSNDSFVVISPVESGTQYRCPFHASNPEKYPTCLINHELHSIESVKRHVKRHHARPPYCPRCSKTFDSVSKCDRHILEKRCRTQSLKIPDGINFYQRNRLAEKDDPQLSDKRRWERIYKTIFPEAESYPSPYLDSGVGLTVSMARDFWRMQGTELIAEFLADQNWLSFGLGDDAQAVLHELVLFDLVTQLVEEGR